MARSSLSTPFLLAFSATLLLAGCGGRDDGTVRISLIGQQSDFTTTKLADLSPAGLLLRSATVEGLVAFDEEGRVIPALADRWIVTEDGQSYIFRLRNGNWPDGKPITGEAAAAALRQTIASLDGTPLALDLAAIDEIRAMAGRVVEVRLDSPMPELLALLAQPELGIAYKGHGSGPMVMREEGAVRVLGMLPPEDRGMVAQDDWADKVRALRLRAESAQSAVERFDGGFVDVVLGGKTDTVPLVNNAGLSRGTVRLDPVTGLFGLMFVHDDGFFARPENREAIALAIDRDALVAAFGVGGWTATTRIVSADAAAAASALIEPDGPGAAAGGALPELSGERWPGLDLAARQARARAQVARWRGAGKQSPTLRLALPDSVGGTLLFERLQADLQAIGLRARRVRPGQAADLGLFDVDTRYGRPEWFLNQLACKADRIVCSAEGDEVLAAARLVSDPVERMRMIAQAEALITAANGFVPLARPLRWSLVRADISGFALNPWAWHPLPPLAEIPR